MARFCILSTLSMSFLKNGYHIVFPYSMCGLTSALYKRMKESLSMQSKVLTIKDKTLLALLT